MPQINVSFKLNVPDHEYDPEHDTGLTSDAYDRLFDDIQMSFDAEEIELVNPDFKGHTLR